LTLDGFSIFVEGGGIVLAEEFAVFVAVTAWRRLVIRGGGDSAECIPGQQQDVALGMGAVETNIWKG